MHGEVLCVVAHCCVLWQIPISGLECALQADSNNKVPLNVLYPGLLERPLVVGCYSRATIVLW